MNDHVLAEDDDEGEDLVQHRRGHRRQSSFFPHKAGVDVGLGLVVEGELQKTVQCFKAGPIPNLEGDMDGVELDLGLLHLDPHLGLEVGRCDRFQLAGSVCCESAPL